MEYHYEQAYSIMHHKLLTNRKVSNKDGRKIFIVLAHTTLLNWLLLNLHFSKFCNDFILKVENHFISAMMLFY